jgi:nucleoside-diphosphate-sugar epimerase
MNRKIVLAGAAGMVGQNLTPLLVESGAHVVALDKNQHNLRLLARLNPGIAAHVVDLAEDGPWPALFAGAAAVVDLKAQIASTDNDVFERNNVRAQERLIEACRTHRIPHLVHLSSSVVISVGKDGYAESKRAAEEMVVRSGLPCTILRPPLMFGCFDVKHLGYITGVLERTPLLPIPGSGRYMRQPLYVLDLCRVILKVLERGPSGAAHNVIGHERIDFIDLLRAIARERGLKRVLVPVPVALFTAALKAAAVVLRRPPFTKEQLEALTAGDDFPVENWTTAFGVAYTPFREGLREVYASPRYRHTAEMISPH